MRIVSRIPKRHPLAAARSSSKGSSSSPTLKKLARLWYKWMVTWSLRKQTTSAVELPTSSLTLTLGWDCLVMRSCDWSVWVKCGRMLCSNRSVWVLCWRMLRSNWSVWVVCGRMLCSDWSSWVIWRMLCFDSGSFQAALFENLWSTSDVYFYT